MSQTRSTYQASNMWSFLAPIFAVIIAIPLSVALTSHFINQQLSTASANSLRSLQQYTPAASTTPAPSATTNQTAGNCAAPVPAAQVPVSMSEPMSQAAAPVMPYHHSMMPPTPSVSTVNSFNTSNQWNATTNTTNNTSLTYNKNSNNVVGSYNNSFNDNSKSSTWTQNNTSTVNADHSFNKDSYNQKTEASYNQLNSNNTSKTMNLAKDNSTVNAPVNNSSNAAVGNDNKQLSTASSKNEVKNITQTDNSQKTTENSHNSLEAKGSFNTAKQEQTTNNTTTTNSQQQGYGNTTKQAAPVSS